VRQRLWLSGLVILILVAAILLYLRSRNPQQAAVAKQTSVILVTVDALRRDMLECYNAEQTLTPHVSDFTDEAVIFNDTVTPAPLSAAGLASIVTGRLPIQHRLRTDTSGVLPNSELTLTEVLREAGFLTGAFFTSQLPHSADLAQNLDTLSVPAGDEIAPRAAFDDALSWLAAHGEAPCFAWIHIASLRGPWRAPHPWALRNLNDPYFGEVAAFDEAWGDFYSELFNQGLLENHHLILIAPTGEALGDEGELEHGILLGEATVQVPWIWRLPGDNAATRRIVGLAATTDLYPTLLGALSVDRYADGPPLEGNDLSPCLSERSETRRGQLLLESIHSRIYGWAPLFGLRQSEWKLVHASTQRLYRLLDNPKQPRDPSGERDQRIAQLDQALGDEISRWSPEQSDAERWRQWGSGQPDPYRQVHISSALVSACRAVQMNDAVSAAEAGSKLIEQFPDNPALVALSADIHRIKGELLLAEAAYRKVLATIPYDAQSRLGLAECLLEQGHISQAKSALGHLRPEASGHPTWLLTKDPEFEYRISLARGSIEAQSGNFETATQHFNQAATLTGRLASRRYAGDLSQASRFLGDVSRRESYPHTHERPLIARMALLLGVPEIGRNLLGFETETPVHHGTTRDPLDTLLQARQAIMEHKISQALRQIEDAVDEKAARPEDCVVLARTLEHQGRLDEAIDLLAFCLPDFPNSSLLHVELARMKLGKRRMEKEALAHLEAALNLGFNDWELLTTTALRRLCRYDSIRRHWADPS
jgi:arylsulfatase A-like enzyme